MSPGHVECKTDNTSDFFKQNAEKFHFNVPKKERIIMSGMSKTSGKNFFFKYLVSSNSIAGHIQCILEKSLKNFWRNAENIA